ncbi:hypothetical protein KJ819_01550 [Patescibacteria group bacterium]|nr:hypothetical protein [Patescibacteria group bacterium]MBU1501031.1 hypothetical protein [Patescibacteria group bacterium]MBU2080661.1 hypothetical protein [Patescibacteria group bacterium]MBU2124264.1 hypothetical protein [Patescibacteria group bacterium]MBU2194390.1 hypothetical protein [Patescibacteria group bacterium]
MDIWKHGSFLDAWSLVHVLSGFFLGLLCYSLGLSLVLSVACTLIALILWEVYEWMLGILETPANVATDIVLGMMGAGVAVYLYFILEKSVPGEILLLLFSFMILLSLWGFLDQYKNGYR